MGWHRFRYTECMNIPQMDHMTDACNHEPKDWCIHCEEGCEQCGSLESNNPDNDWNLCDECSLSRSISQAESMSEGDR